MTAVSAETVERIKVAIRAGLRDDYLSLWDILHLIRAEEPPLNTAQLRLLARHILRELLDGGRVIAGIPASDGIEFDAWDLSTEQTLHQIDTVWGDLRREPDRGEIVWFAAYDPASELLDQVSDRASFFAFVRALIADRQDEAAQELIRPSSSWGSGANGWEHWAIEDYLDAALSRAQSGSTDGMHDFPEESSWKAFADFLYWGKVYE